MGIWMPQYPIDFSPTGDTTSQAIEKFINENNRIYDLLNRVRKFDAGTIAPSDPVEGHAWLDTSSKPWRLKVYDGSAWRLIQSLTYPMFKNRIINGDFAVWQRGTSASYASDSVNLTYDVGYKSADRIGCENVYAGGQFTVSKGNIDGYNSFKVTVDTPPDNLTWDGTNVRYWIPFLYRFEGQHLYDLAIKKAKITISFLFKSNVSGNFSIALRNATSLSHSTYDAYVTTFQYDGSEVSQRITKTIPLDYQWAESPRNDENIGFILFIGYLGDGQTTNILDQWQTSTSGNAVGAPYSPLCATDYTNWASQAGNYIEIAQLQLEEGEVATDFEYVPYDVQLMRCMRYYEKIEDTDTGNQKWFWLPSTDYTARYFVWVFKVPKRCVPSITHTYYTTGTINVNAIRPFNNYVEFGVDLGNTSDEVKLIAATADAEL